MVLKNSTILDEQDTKKKENNTVDCIFILNFKFISNLENYQISLFMFKLRTYLIIA